MYLQEFSFEILGLLLKAFFVIVGVVIKLEAVAECTFFATGMNAAREERSDSEKSSIYYYN